MATRLKVFLIIMGIVLVISASSVVISISSAQNQILKTLENDMQMLVSLANEYMTGEINMLKTDATTVTEMLKSVPIHEIHQLLIEQVIAYEDFDAIAVFNAAGKIEDSYSMGAAPPPEALAAGEYGKMAFDGNRVITGSHKDPASGELVFYIFLPLLDHNFSAQGEDSTAVPRRLLGLTVPGAFFTERVKRLMMWNTGSMTLVDRSGTIIADAHDEWVNGQFNFPQMAAAEPQYQDIARVIQRMISETDNHGADRYTIGREIDEVVAFTPIDTPEQWAVAVSTSVAESPFYRVQGMIAISGIIFLALGLLAAALASGVIAKPFEIAKAASKAKTAFIANMSHDMRTPLNAVIGLSELGLTRPDLPQDIKAYQHEVYKSGNTILGVVNDLLDISNIESGKFGIISSEYNLPNFILDTAKTNVLHLGDRPVLFHIVPEGNLLTRLMGDALRIQQIFNNLLNNAILHTTEGTIEWKIATERDGDTVWLVSSVSDTGGGIEPDEVDKLFLDYSSQETQQMRSAKGSGLGLALTKKIVDLMNGTISVESTLGKGTVLTVRLPHTYVSEDYISADLKEKLLQFKVVGQEQSENFDIHRVQLPQARVLMVDDAHTNRKVARGMLAPYGIQVDCVSSGKEAVELIRKGEPRYNAIFMNRWMPEMDGTEAVRIIRNEVGSDYAKNVPIIAMTVMAVTGNNTFFQKAGFQDVISKPISVRRLDEVINRWVAGQQ